MLGMRLARVLQMSIDEVVVRGRQEASKWLDRMTAVSAPVTLPEGAMSPGAGVRGRSMDNGQGVPTWLLDHVRKDGPFSFFEGAVDADTVARLIERMPESRERILSAANMICQGRFDLLGYRGLDFGDPPDWHLDPLSGRHAPLVHWSRLNPVDPATVGDCKVVWELNRHQWLLLLGQAYRLTRDERYAEVFARFLRAWMEANPPGMGVNWSSSLEVALRLISWCWAVALFKGSRALSAPLLNEMLAGVKDHARHVDRYLSLYFAPNTHLTGEALGLFYAGVLFPSLPRAKRWRARGAEILIDQCERQILPDGVYFEQSTCYQRYTAEIYLHFLILAARNGIDVPDAMTARLQRLLDFLLMSRRPDGSMPQIGDADGGWTLPLIPRDPNDLRGVLSVAAAFFGRSDYAWGANGLAPETLWLLGAAGAKTFEELAPAPPTAPSRLFPDGGYLVMGSGWERNAHQLIFDVGPLDCLPTAAHGHADLLSIQCAAFGQPYLVDPGTYCYAAEPAWRDFFRSTAAHSTITVDGVGQAVPAGLFKWQARPRARLRRWLSSAAMDFADASHDAYCRFSDPVVHRRRVLFVKPRYWVIVDDLEGAADHVVALRFQFAPVEVMVGPDLWARARGTGGHGLLIRPFATVPLTQEIHEGAVSPIQGWASPGFGLRQPAPAVTYSASTRLPLRILTLLLPTVDPAGVPPAVALLLDGAGRPMGLDFAGGNGSVRLGEDDLVIVQDGEGVHTLPQTRTVMAVP